MTTTQTTYLSGLPKDIWVQIASLGSQTEAIHLSKTCKDLHSFIQDNSTVWEKIYENKFGEGTAKSLKGKVQTIKSHLLIDTNLKRGCFYPWTIDLGKNTFWMKMIHNIPGPYLGLISCCHNIEQGGIDFHVDLPGGTGYFEKISEENPLRERCLTALYSHHHLNPISHANKQGSTGNNNPAVLDLSFLANPVVTSMIISVPTARELKKYNQNTFPSIILCGLNEGSIFVGSNSLRPSLPNQPPAKIVSRMSNVFQVHAQRTAVRCLAHQETYLSPFGIKFYSAGDDNTLKAHVISISKIDQTLSLHLTSDDLKSDTPIRINKLVVKGNKLYAGGKSHIIQIWDTDTRKCIQVLSLVDKGDDNIYEKFSVDGLHASEDRLFAAYHGRAPTRYISEIKIWDLDSLQYLDNIITCYEFRPTCLTSYGPKLFAGEKGGSVEVWDIYSKDSKDNIAFFEPAHDCQHDCQVEDIAIKDGLLCALNSTAETSNIQSWSLHLSQDELIDQFSTHAVQLPPLIKNILANHKRHAEENQKESNGQAANKKMKQEES